MTERAYDPAWVAYCQRMNRSIEREWAQNQREGRPPEGQAEWAWRRDQREGRHD